ncbi:hypothetical protein PGR6_12670 [Pseudomonas sp. GR 6-02]|nr:hypothetical protein PGR6_12670 [Pseudomonas sp. GR 6-02]
MTQEWQAVILEQKSYITLKAAEFAAYSLKSFAGKPRSYGFLSITR